MWTKYISTKHNAPYWFNQDTGESRWEEPREQLAERMLPNGHQISGGRQTSEVITKSGGEMAKSEGKSSSRKRPREEGENDQTVSPATESTPAPPCPEHLLWKRKYLFRDLGEEIVNELRMDEVSAFSITEVNSAATMTKVIFEALQQLKRRRGLEYTDTCILDGMSCVGGNTISFATKFDRVLSNELDKSRYSMLQYNAESVMHLRNIQFFNRSVLDVAFDRDDYDVLFLDPEWGGPDYKESEKPLILPISDQSMEEFCLSVLKRMPRVSMIALKLPLNYDNDYIRAFAAKHELSYTFETNGLRKMSLTLLTLRT